MIQLSRDIRPYYSGFGILVQKDGDGGDGAHKTATYYYLMRRQGYNTDHLGRNLYAGAELAFNELETEPGWYVRHPCTPGSAKFWCDPKEFSRDQQTPLVLAFAALGMRERFVQVMKNHIKRLGKFQNKDFASPETVAIYIRGLYELGDKAVGYTLYPFVLLGDIFTTFNSIIRVVKSYFSPDDVSDDLNHILVLDQQKRVLSTPISALARWIYKSFRAHAGETLETRNMRASAPQSTYDLYFREAAGGPPINDIARPLIKELFYE